MVAGVGMTAKGVRGMQLMENSLGRAGKIFMHSARYLSTCSASLADTNR
jgi:hypothetical protein